MTHKMENNGKEQKANTEKRNVQQNQISDLKFLYRIVSHL